MIINKLGKDIKRISLYEFLHVLAKIRSYLGILFEIFLFGFIIPFFSFSYLILGSSNVFESRNTAPCYSHACLHSSPSKCYFISQASILSWFRIIF